MGARLHEHMQGLGDRAARPGDRLDLLIGRSSRSSALADGDRGGRRRRRRRRSAAAPPPARPRPLRWPTVTSSTASTAPTLGRRRRPPGPGVSATRGPRKAARPPAVVMKHTSWLSGLAAVRRPSAAARRRTSALVMSPTGNSVRASWSLAEHVEHVALVLGPVGATRDAADVPSGARRCGRGGRWRRRRSRAARPARSSRSNLRWRLHSMHGFGVRPAAWAATYGSTTWAVEVVAEVEHVVVDAELLRPPGGRRRRR